MTEPLAGVFRGLPVLVAGHAGFKGHGAGHHPDLFSALHLAERLDHRVADVRDAREMQEFTTAVMRTVVFQFAPRTYGTDRGARGPAWPGDRARDPRLGLGQPGPFLLMPARLGPF